MVGNKVIVAYNRTTEDSLYLIHILNDNGDHSFEQSPLSFIGRSRPWRILLLSCVVR